MKPDPTLICNGMTAGLVAISGPCPFVDTWAAIIVGAVAGSMVVGSVLLLERAASTTPWGRFPSTASPDCGASWRWASSPTAVMAPVSTASPATVPD